MSVRTLNALDKYSFRNTKNLLQPIKMDLSKNLKALFSIFLLNFWNLNKILNILMTLLSYVFSKLQTVKCMIRQIST